MRPSSDSSPEHVILDTSPTQTVTRMSSLGCRDDTVNRETTKRSERARTYQLVCENIPVTWKVTLSGSFRVIGDIQV